MLGAMLAGIVLRSWTRRMGVAVEPLEVSSKPSVTASSSDLLRGLRDVARRPVHHPEPARLLVFLLLLLVVRGLPSLLIYAGTLPMIQRLEMTFSTATTMPLLIALAEIGLRDGTMLPANAAALVGAGMLSVLFFPSIAATLHKRGRRGRRAAAQPAPSGAASEGVPG